MTVHGHEGCLAHFGLSHYHNFEYRLHARTSVHNVKQLTVNSAEQRQNDRLLIKTTPSTEVDYKYWVNGRHSERLRIETLYLFSLCDGMDCICPRNL